LCFTTSTISQLGCDSFPSHSKPYEYRIYILRNHKLFLDSKYGRTKQLIKLTVLLNRMLHTGLRTATSQSKNPTSLFTPHSLSQSPARTLPAPALHSSSPLHSPSKKKKKKNNAAGGAHAANPNPLGSRPRGRDPSPPAAPAKSGARPLLPRGRIRWRFASLTAPPVPRGAALGAAAPWGR
jgi:hypothetical protein